MIVAVAVVGVSCGRPTAPIAAPSPPPTRSATVPTAAAIPMVLDTGAPSHLPEVGLQVRAGHHIIALRGVPFTAEFLTRRVVALLSPRYPVPWPSPSAIDAGTDPTITIDTHVVPDWVVIKTYAHIEPGSLVPSPAPTTVFGCDRFSAPRCTIRQTKAGVRVVDLGRNIFAGDYVVVFCVWHVPPAEQRGPDAPGDAAASWLFHVSRAQPLGASAS